MGYGVLGGGCRALSPSGASPRPSPLPIHHRRGSLSPSLSVPAPPVSAHLARAGRGGGAGGRRALQGDQRHGCSCGAAAASPSRREGAGPGRGLRGKGRDWDGRGSMLWAGLVEVGGACCGGRGLPLPNPALSQPNVPFHGRDISTATPGCSKPRPI